MRSKTLTRDIKESERNLTVLSRKQLVKRKYLKHIAEQSLWRKTMGAIDYRASFAIKNIPIIMK